MGPARVQLWQEVCVAVFDPEEALDASWVEISLEVMLAVTAHVPTIPATVSTATAHVLRRLGHPLSSEERIQLEREKNSIRSKVHLQQRARRVQSFQRTLADMQRQSREVSVSELEFDSLESPVEAKKMLTQCHGIIREWRRNVGTRALLKASGDTCNWTRAYLLTLAC